MSGFTHLRIHSEYSLVDSTVRLGPLLSAARAMGLPALAITDESNLFALVKFYRKALDAGIKPIVGADILLRMPDAEATVDVRATVLCMHRDGYRHLSQLLTRAQLEGRTDGVCRIEPQWLDELGDGLILLLSCAEGGLADRLGAGATDVAEAWVRRWCAGFEGRLYLEIQRAGQPRAEAQVAGAVELASRLDLPLVATNGVRFLRQDDYQTHEIRVCIHDGHRLDDPGRPRRYTPEQYLKSADEMRELFADLPAAIENSMEIARRCNLVLEFGTNVLPDFPVPEGHTTESFLAEQAREGLDRRLAKITREIDEQEYRERLETEIEVINQMGFPGYFLIVADFIRWARENDVPVGPGRGSGAGSLVAYALEITDLDPLEFALLFERFLNPERISMPDFDIDFCIEGRDRVIEYVAQRYGRDHVSQIITYGSMAAKAVVRDVGRVLGHAYGFCDRISKMIPFEVGITLERALSGLDSDDYKAALAKGRTLPELIRDSQCELARAYREDEEVTQLIDEALKLEGLSRNAGKHAGGVVIAPTPLTEFTPLYLDPEGHPVTQFDKDDVEAVGLVKFDFLGLKTLTVVNNAAKLVNAERARAGEPPIDVRYLRIDDENVYKTLNDGKLTALFQIESVGMRRLVRKLAPNRFDDIISLLALFRPGPLQSGMVDDFVERRHGRAELAYPHQRIEAILEPTYGIILYQEQVMQIAQVLCGYSLGGADLLRRAMGKKKPEIMAKERANFVAGAEATGVDPEQAGGIFDLIEKFAGYGFNKSHSAAYAYVAYQTAWLKTYYPAQFMCATMTADLDHTEKLVPLLDECRLLGLEVLGPDVNASDYRFAVCGERHIRYGLGALKGVGQGHVEAIVEEREANGRYRDLFDFCHRIDSRRLNRRVVESLIKAGALDALGPNRASLMGGLDAALGAAEQQAAAQEAGQTDLFGDVAAAPSDHNLALPELSPWRVEELLQAEKDALGLYFSVHPMDPYREELSAFSSTSIAEHIAGGVTTSSRRYDAGREVVATGVLWAVRIMGNRAFLTLDDGTARLRMALFDDQLRRYERFLHKERALIVYGRLGYDENDGEYRIRAQHILDLDEARRRYARLLRIGWPAGRPIAEFKDLVHRFRAEQGAQVAVRVVSATASGELRLPLDWRVDVCAALLNELRGVCGHDAVKVVFRRPDFGQPDEEAA